MNENDPLNPTLSASGTTKLILDRVTQNKEFLSRNYVAGFGIFPSAERESNFYNQVYARDSAHAIANYYARANPGICADTLETIFKYQKPSGLLPLRVEREYQEIKILPGLRFMAKPLFTLIEEKIMKRKERPIYEGGDLGLSTAQDTIPAIVIACGEFFLASSDGRDFVKAHFEKIKKSVEYFKEKSDQIDGLFVSEGDAPDWADTLKREGKLGDINILWCKGLYLMEYMSRELGHPAEADAYMRDFHKVKESVMKKLYDKDEGYFRAKVGEDRLDTVATVFGAYYFLTPEEAVGVEETLARRVLHSSGLENFDPKYGAKDMIWISQLAGHAETYHNQLVWPWVTLENIQVKIKIAMEHKDASVREKYKTGAIQDLVRISKLFYKIGGACEICEPDTEERGFTPMYNPPANFMGSIAAYQGAYDKMEKLGWL